MHSGTIVLFIVMAAGILGRNNLVALAAGAVLVMQALPGPGIFRFLEQYASKLGITFLLIGFLLPFATGRIGLSTAARSLITSTGLVAIIIGAVSACLAADGVSLLSRRPDVMVGMVFGSVLGVFFLGGIPAGPLVAAGLASLVFRFIR